MTYQLLQGDCLDVMRSLPAASCDAVICDPPAGISFMSREFDSARGGRDTWVAWLAERLSTARRVLKPGHYALVWALPRTSHWTGMACEDAGFTVIDRVSHIFGSGFPKGKNKLKPAVEDWWLIRSPGPAAALHIDACRVGTSEDTGRPTGALFSGMPEPGGIVGGETVSHPAGRWPPNLLIQHSSGCIPNGVKRVRGTASRSDVGTKTNGTYGEFNRNSAWSSPADADGREEVADWLCQDGCPVRELGEMSGESVSRRSLRGAEPTGNFAGMSQGGAGKWESDIERGHDDAGTAARFYPNLDPPEWVCDESCPIAALDEQSGELRPGERPARANSSPGANGTLNDGWKGGIVREREVLDAGGASRYYPNLDPPFFYAAKASRRERNDGCDNLYWHADDTRGSGYRPITRAEYEAAQAAGERVARGNMHPTVKNIKLLSWLINLLTVPGDVILDPFMGSGSIGVAALQGGRSFVGIEMDEDYLSICEHRLAHAAEQPRQMEIAV